MSEKNMRGIVVGALRVLDAVAVENSAYPGTPDVNYKEGWVELKELDRWPDSDVVLIPHYTQQQRVWILRRHRSGGNVFLLLKVSNEWLLFDGYDASKYVGRASRGDLEIRAMEHWYSNEAAKEGLLKCLRSRP